MTPRENFVHVLTFAERKKAVWRRHHKALVPTPAAHVVAHYDTETKRRADAGCQTLALLANNNTARQIGPSQQEGKWGVLYSIGQLADCLQHHSTAARMPTAPFNQDTRGAALCQWMRAPADGLTWAARPLGTTHLCRGCPETKQIVAFYYATGPTDQQPQHAQWKTATATATRQTRMQQHVIYQSY